MKPNKRLKSIRVPRLCQNLLDSHAYIFPTSTIMNVSGFALGRREAAPGAGASNSAVGR